MNTQNKETPWGGDALEAGLTEHNKKVDAIIAGLHNESYRNHSSDDFSDKVLAGGRLVADVRNALRHCIGLFPSGVFMSGGFGAGIDAFLQLPLVTDTPPEKRRELLLAIIGGMYDAICRDINREPI